MSPPAAHLVSSERNLMVKKLQKLAAKQKASGSAGLGGIAGLLDSDLASSVRESAQQIWLAGLGAFTRAQGEGSKAFETLVKQGTLMQRKTQAVAEEKIGEVASKMTNIAGEVGSKAGQHWDKLETIFEEGVAKALNKLGMPSSKEVQDLIARIDALSRAVAKLEQAKAPGQASSRDGAGAAKPVAKRSAKTS